MSLQQEIVGDLIDIENDLGNPTFTWNGSTYNFIPSVAEFNRMLETGGFQLVRELKATVRLWDIADDGSLQSVFNGIVPQPQQKFTYSIDGVTYRIGIIRPDPTNSYFRIIAYSVTKGV